MHSDVIDDDTKRLGRLLHYGGFAAVLILGATAFHWMYVPVQKDIFDVEIRLDELTQTARNADAIRDEHHRLSSRLEKIEDRYATLRRRVPQNAEAGSFLKDVSEIAKEEKFEIDNFQPTGSTEETGYSAMEVLLEGQGSFGSICSFFDRLSKIQRLSKVRRLSILVDSRAETGTYPIEATIVIYFGLKAQRSAAGPRGADRG